MHLLGTKSGEVAYTGLVWLCTYAHQRNQSYVYAKQNVSVKKIALCHMQVISMLICDENTIE